MAVSPSPAQEPLPTVSLVPIVEDAFFSPVALTNAGDASDRLFVVEQRGQIRVVNPEGAVLPAPFLDLSDRLVPVRAGFDERGLLGLAFHPDYGVGGAAGEGRFYVYYSAPDDHDLSTDPHRHRSVISEFRVLPGDVNLADPASERILLEIEQPQFNHNSGQLAFGPDRMLYIGVGDGGSSNDNNEGHTGGSPARPGGVLGNSQDLTRLLGKILRIDPLGNDGPGGDYGIPPDNPFAGLGGGERAEIHAFGLRNPWGFSFDPATGRLFSADVGQGKYEEINLITPGGNYGWRIREAGFPFDTGTPNPSGRSPIEPIAQYAHPGQGIPGIIEEIGASVTGGYVYRGWRNRNLGGVYLFADWSGTFDPATSGTLLALRESSTNSGEFFLETLDVVGGNPVGAFINALGVDERQELYVLTKDTVDPAPPQMTGSLFRIDEGGGTGQITTEISADRDNSIFSEGDLSNGAGDFLFSGQTGQGNTRSALVHFDLDGIPGGATVEAATLQLTINRSRPGTHQMNVHRLTRDWGEGTSDSGDPGGSGAASTPGDATWTHAVSPGTMWTAAGGDFVAQPTAINQVSTSTGTVEWTSEQMKLDVADWIGGAPNFGWIITGEAVDLSAKRFSSREGDSPPRLVLEYSVGEPRAELTSQDRWESRFFPYSQSPDDADDLDFDGRTILEEYGLGLNPLGGDSPEAFPHLETASTVPSGGVFVFRRDTTATGLIYRVNYSDDLVHHETIAESTGGAPVTGTGFVSETPLESPYVEVRVTAPGGPGSPTGFFQLFITRG